MKRLLNSLLFVTTLSLLVGLPVFAQERRAMTLVDLLTIPSLGDPQLAPSGSEILYTLTTPDWKQSIPISHIWLANADGTGSNQLTNGEKGESSPRWSPDGKWVAFLAARGEARGQQIFLIGAKGGEARQVSNHVTSVANIRWSPDGRYIYFIAANDKAESVKAGERIKDDIYAFEENYQQRHLWRIAVANQREEQITTGDFSVLEYDLSEDGKRVILQRAPTPLLDSGFAGESWVMDISGQNPVQITRNKTPELGAQISPDGSQVLFTADANADFDFYYNRKLFLTSAKGGTAQILLPDFPHEVQGASWSKDGQSIFFIANMGLHSELFRVTLATGAVEQLTDGRHSIRAWMYAPESNLHLISFDEPTNPGDLWILASNKGAKLRQVTHLFDHLSRDFKLPRQEKIVWKGKDGVTVEGILFYPIEYRQEDRYPLVVQTHGGPQSSDKFGFHGSWTSYVQVLTARGYAVLKPNYRGSTGYGDAFLRDMVGQYYRNAHLDVLTGVDHVISLGIADSNRLIAMGYSAGGSMTHKLITYTTRFKAAAAGAGTANWMAMYAQSDIRAHRSFWFSGTPWQENAPIDRYLENSPLKDAAKAKTPTIIFVGEQDVRNPMPLSVEMYRALKSNGVPTHLYVAPREPHGWREPRHLLFKMNAELEWFERHVLGRTYTWEKAPQ
jgi:dipeptidyl aminopeptidase/acylaminoacyl peptidase